MKIIARVNIWKDGQDLGYRTIKITDDDLKRLAQDMADDEYSDEDASFVAECDVLTHLHL
jgi:hypothetical protein